MQAEAQEPGPLEKQRETNTAIIGQGGVPRTGFTLVPNRLLFAKGLTQGAKLTYTLLLSYAWQDGRCFPGQERLSEDLGVERKAVIRYLKELKDVGLVRVIRRGLGQTNLYVLPKLAEVPFLVESTAPAVAPRTEHTEVPPRGQPIVSLVGRNKHAADNIQKEKENDSNVTALCRNAERLIPVLEKKSVSVPLPRPSDNESSEQDAASAITAVLVPLRRAFCDTASSRATTARALHLLDYSGLDAPRFLQVVYAAADRTQASLLVGAITGNPMAYFFACLVQLLDDKRSHRIRPVTSRRPVLGVQREANSVAHPITVPEESHPVWRCVQQELASTLASSCYRDMVEPTSVLTADEQILHVAVRTVFQRDWLTNRLGKRITDILSDLGKEGMRVEFVLP